ncbi:hypothetical protein BDW22DRAFT_1425769 [Trametopsis cervina]|nr:hypothetical protein BDW22DRAFT_1425769 [Trametopsis cervina]
MHISSLSRHTLRQLKFIGPGAIATFWLNTHQALRDVLLGETSYSWARTSAFFTLLLGVVTVTLFLYILLIPLIQGIQPDFRHWRQSGVLSSVIPILTGSIVMGWTTLVLTLGRWTELGYIKGTIGASGLYALVFGLMGLIPVPNSYQRS